MAVEIFYARAEIQERIPVPHVEGLCALDAVLKSGLLDRHPELKPASLALARFGVRIAHDAPLLNGDRIDVLRPLLLSPEEARRQRLNRRS